MELTKGFSKTALASAALALGFGFGAVPAQARDVCGWYAIAFCSKGSGPAYDFADRGWGQVIKTNAYRGFQRGFFCVVSGPQSQASAKRDARLARQNGVSRSAYVKRACTDESNVGD
ncbi:MAG TPA: hypothetical protein DCL48_09285 [Alphaproteobacteria bacterium]|nr:hypothetical protein [Alphaproteobacteria bacterium]